MGRGVLTPITKADSEGRQCVLWWSRTQSGWVREKQAALGWACAFRLHLLAPGLYAVSPDRGPWAAPNPGSPGAKLASPVSFVLARKDLSLCSPQKASCSE